MNNIVKLFVEKGFLLDREMLDFFNELDDNDVANEILNKIAIVSQKKIITKGLVGENIEKINPILYELDDGKKKLVNKYFVDTENLLFSASPNSKEFEESNKDIGKNVEQPIIEDLNYIKPGNVKVLSSPVIVSKKLEVRNFVKHFRSRYNSMKKLLMERPELDNLISIDKITGNSEVSIIGIVTSKQITKNKNLILQIEDLTGSAKLLINQNKEEIYEKSKEILLDDIIGFKCNGTRDFLFVNDLFYPDINISEKKRLDEETYAIFISDIHVGSNNFLGDNFMKFINWLNGEGSKGNQKETLKKIKYMFVVGDTIEGVGVYPGQEKELVIKDIKTQYDRLAEFYAKIPKHIQIIQCAGQHDGVRVPEPQPPVGEEFGEALHKLPNMHLVSNPSLIEIGATEEKGGIKVLMYHGASMHNIIGEIEELRLINAHSSPAKVIKHLLLRRHLAPTHGATTYIPGDEDPMLILEIPDIITTGDLHRTDIDSYNNILIIANSCWQARTAFEEKVGNDPDPCKVPILNLKSREIRILDFTGDDTGGENESEQ